MLTQARARARRRGLPFGLVVDDIHIPDTCPILGIPLVIRSDYRKRSKRPPDDSPSLDRLIPELGYLPGNVRIISNRANRIRADATRAELEAIVRYLKKEGVP